jgi:Carboxypeptidase regulatory-like domain
MTRCLLLALLTAAMVVAQVVSSIGGAPNQAPPQPPPGTASIEGTVVNDATNEPVKKAQVSLFGGVGKALVAVTDASGSFAFHKLPVGAFMISATHEGFDENRGALLGDNQKQVTLTADQNATGVELRLPPTGAISGRLTDEVGDGAPNCSVGAIAAGSPGIGIQQQLGVANTDDRGEYRIANLPAGRYMVYQHCQQTLAAPHGFMERGDPRTPVWTWIPGFYGGAEGGAGASTLTVHGGEEVRGIDFRLKVTNAFTVPIVVVPDDPGIDLRTVSVRLMPRDPATALVMQYGVGRPTDAGPWRAFGVAPGAYVAMADFQQTDARWHGEAAVDVGDTPPDPVRLPLTPAMTIHGDLEVEKGDAPGSASSGRPPGTVALSPLDPLRGGAYAMAQVNADGSFAIPGVIPGRYQLQAMGPGNGIESVTLSGHEVSPRAIDFGPGAGGPLHVVLNAKRAQVQVTVSDVRPDRTTWVILLPKGVTDPGPGMNPPMGQAQQGPLTITAPPGEYVAFAIECAQPWPLLTNSTAFHALAGLGKSVEAKADGNASVTVEVITRDDLKRALDSDSE